MKEPIEIERHSIFRLSMHQTALGYEVEVVTSPITPRARAPLNFRTSKGSARQKSDVVIDFRFVLQQRAT